MVTDALLQLAPESDSTVLRSKILRRGMYVRLLETQGAFVRVLHQEVTLRDGEQVVTGRQTGWVLRTAITQEIDQHFYHLLTGDTTKTEWRVIADGEHVITCRWCRLAEAIELSAPYDRWLRDYHRALRQA